MNYYKEIKNKLIEHKKIYVNDLVPNPIKIKIKIIMNWYKNNLTKWNIYVSITNKKGRLLC